MGRTYSSDRRHCSHKLHPLCAKGGSRKWKTRQFGSKGGPIRGWTIVRVFNGVIIIEYVKWMVVEYCVLVLAGRVEVRLGVSSIRWRGVFPVLPALRKLLENTPPLLTGIVAYLYVIQRDDTTTRMDLSAEYTWIDTKLCHYGAFSSSHNLFLTSQSAVVASRSSRVLSQATPPRPSSASHCLTP